MTTSPSRVAEEREVLGWSEFGGASRGPARIIVDDDSDSGRTRAMVNTTIEKMGADVRTVVLYTKPGRVHEPRYTWRRTSLWITSPWSALPPVEPTV